MLSVDVIRKVKELEIHTRRALIGSRIGGSKSRQKGFGFEFDQLRSYQYGDDVRMIDWKSSARSGNNQLLVRQYLEDRNRTIVVCLDISASTFFGSGKYLKQDVMQQIAGILALAASWAQDKVGLILFSDCVEKVVPAKKGAGHVHEILNEIFAHEPVGKQTNFDVLYDHIATRVAKRAIVLLVSDFIGYDDAKSLKKISRDKDVIAITYQDAQELQVSDVGYVWMQDCETGQIELVNSSGSGGQRLAQQLQKRVVDQKLLLGRSNIDVVCLQNQATFIHDLLIFFQKRIIF